MYDFSAFSDIRPSESLTAAGFRFGDRGTQTSRTMMLNEITTLLDNLSADADSAEYTAKIVDENALGKQTSANRRLTGQRLRELYGLDARLPIFRVLRKLWAIDQLGHVLAVYLAHRVAIRTFANRAIALMSQYPMLTLMVVYTVISRWIIAQPIVQEGR